MEIELLSMWNYVKNDYDHMAQLPNTAEELRPYIPQGEMVQRLFGLYMQMGYAPLTAMEKTLKACVPQKAGE